MLGHFYDSVCRDVVEFCFAVEFEIDYGYELVIDDVLDWVFA